MQVDLANLEPGSVVETPKELAERGTKSPQLIYTGVYNQFPKFMEHSGKEWKTVFWPSAPSQEFFIKYLPLPSGFEVTEDKKLAKRFAADWFEKQIVLGEAYSSGCDPEIFVTDVKGKVIPARKVLPKKSGTYTPAFYDGIQAEFCPGAGGCLEGLGSRIRSMLSKLQADFRMKHKNAKLSIQNSVLLTQEEMDKLDDEDVVFRCSESINIYNDIPGIQEPRKYLWRFTGGHIHVGANNGSTKPAPLLYGMVRAMDSILGVASVSLARSFDTPERRKNYGRAGECRFPSHGLEYRVLSNFWLCSPLIYHLVFEIARWAYRLGESGLFQAAWDGSEQETRECINNCDVALAQKIIKRNAGIYNKGFEERWGAYKKLLITKAMDTIMNGLETVVKDPTDIAGNWYFTNGDWGAYGGDIPNAKWRNLRCS